MKEMPYEEWTRCDCENSQSYGEHYRQEKGMQTKYADDIALWKQISNAQAAAEYWRARAGMCSTTPVFTSGAELQKFIQVWERFATHPHARDTNYE